MAFAWLKLFVAWNWKKYASYLVLLATTYLIWGIGACNNPDPSPPPPLPTPPEPDIPPLPDFDDLGWRPISPEEREKIISSLPYPQFCDTPAGRAEMEDIFSDTADALVFRLANRGRSMTGQRPYASRNQGQVGSCVGFAAAAACEYAMAATNALRKGGPIQELPDLVQEVIYAGSRVEVNGGRVPFSGDGSTGAWAAKWLSTGGNLARGVYGTHDLTAYSESRCRQWGDRGVPDELEPIAARQTVISVTLVRTTDEAKKALAQGYALFICSNVGFGQRGPYVRDRDGFLTASGTWAHCMAVIGYQGGSRPGYLILNSWGPRWVSGPSGRFSDIPDGSFWCDETTMGRILSQGDSYAVSGVRGFPRRKIAIDDWIADAGKPVADMNLTISGMVKVQEKGWPIVIHSELKGRREDE
ncbi:MAG: hypothetical protein N2112_12900 [Gemmataceae bacterium]|nr:hypothetical protein [Gemmataceae bacterium]